MKKVKGYLIFTCLLAVVIVCIAAINKKEATVSYTVTGRVTDASSGQGLPGVNVVLLGTNTGISTDVLGDYSLQVPNLSGTLVFSYIGYETQEVDIEGRTNINIELSTNIGGSSCETSGCYTEWPDCGKSKCDLPSGLGYYTCSLDKPGSGYCDSSTATSNRNCGGHSCSTFGCAAYSGSLSCDCSTGLCYC